MTVTLGELGLESPMVASWLVARDQLVLSLAVDAVFLQTPGATAGAAVAYPA